MPKISSALRELIDTQDQNKTVESLDKKENFDAIIEVNRSMADVRREYRSKEKNSQLKASRVVLSR
jgi:hypothetical protein